MAGAWGPTMDDKNWIGWSLSVPSISYMLSDHSVYEYKLPYSVPSSTCCTRIHPYLYCCDVYCCSCFNAPGCAPALSFVDVVNQEDGHQVRYRTEKRCCRVPRILTFMDGQFLGDASRTMRCGNRCLVCLEDFQKKDVLQVGLHNDKGDQMARIDRNGRGKCVSMSCSFPMKCTGCCFNICVGSMICKPGAVTPCCGCLDCDPVCCECCVKGDTELCAVRDMPCCCIGCPMVAPSCWCCCPTMHTKNFESVSTIMLQDFEVVDSKSREPVGKMQSQFRGNYPSAYTHYPLKAFKVNGHTATGKIGTLLSAVAAGMVFPMGGALPTFAGLTAKPEGTSPDFSGWVSCGLQDQMKKFLESAVRDDLVVDKDMVFGTSEEGTQVKGWLMTEFGYAKGGFKYCGMSIGGKVKTPISVKQLDEVQKMFDLAVEDQIGNHGVTFWMRFKLPDMEKQIVKKGQNHFGDVEGLSAKFNPKGGGFVDQMEEVSLACSCIRFCRFPCNFTQEKDNCCTCPCYARVLATSKVAPSAWAEPPPNIVMSTIPKTAFGSGKA